MRDATCVVLAAGSATRMGREKLALPFRDGTILDAALAACEGYPSIVVASEALLRALPALQSDPRVVVNEHPERGMAHSLRLGNRMVPPERALVVVLGDKPLVERGLVSALLAHDADVVFPARDGIAGHPVVFSPRARARIEALPDGDTIRALRDDPALTRQAVNVRHDGAFVDVDTEDDYRRLH